jgi:hypothetical protein
LLHDPKSSVVSNFLHVTNYKDGDDFVSYEEYHKLQQSNRDPMSEFISHAEILEKQIRKVEQVSASLNDMESRILGEMEAVQSEKQASDRFYQQWSSDKSEQVQTLISEKVEKLHSQFNEAVSSNEPKLEFSGKEESGMYHKVLNDQEKIQLMR